MKTRLEKLRNKLDKFKGRCVLGWVSPYMERGSFVNLESAFLLAAMKNKHGDYVACRFAGTLEQNEIKHQRVLFEGETLVRIRNGPRMNLVVNPSHLRYEETAVVAGLNKELVYAPGSASFYHKRDGDIAFLRQLETLLDRNTTIPVSSTPYPEAYKKVRDPTSVQPRITGELIRKLKALEDYDSTVSAATGFYNHLDQFYEKREGSYVFPLALVNGRGLTLLDLSGVANESYVLPIEDVDVDTELMRIAITKTLEKDKSEWSS